VPDRLAIVTGGAHEEGLSAAEALLRAGYPVAIWDDDREALGRSGAELRGQGLYPREMRQVDVASQSQMSSAYAALRCELGPPFALLNFAQLKNTFVLGERGQRRVPAPELWELDPARVQRLCQVNTLGAYLCASAVVPDMLAAGGGCIVHVSSGPSTREEPAHVPFGPSMAFVEAFSQAMARRLEPDGVRVNVITSGGHANRRGQADPANQPSDWMAPLVVYLLSDEAKGVTGQVLSPARAREEVPAC
jgi:NAD(P)-dependent dehydrogenase (short-subunit alcohol dehydrogenase family)